ncbi:TPR repeat protein [Metarhizium album ARSEF 1941]|uniref:TPR repeat protein n=1 Tax=Metarhizium album (strain ARSEF 1941) TaxID=1081103 RepID=A0A0B2WU47_METAS|nr:TPR repeat protein [Metarhizium album ARSEF 1941]KHN96992.1 TPR repeat protein [Metarhizium album ARSEF 1941]
MSGGLLTQYDALLDENDWDIYYWATQREPSDTYTPTNPSMPASRSGSSTSTQPSPDAVVRSQPPRGEWAQTVGNFKPAYRPVPERWRGSEVLALLRAHVRSKSVDGADGGGMAFMPALEGR